MEKYFDKVQMYEIYPNGNKWQIVKPDGSYVADIYNMDGVYKIDYFLDKGLFKEWVKTSDGNHLLQYLSYNSLEDAVNAFEKEVGELLEQTVFVDFDVFAKNEELIECIVKEDLGNSKVECFDEETGETQYFNSVDDMVDSWF